MPSATTTSSLLHSDSRLPAVHSNESIPTMTSAFPATSASTASTAVAVPALVKAALTRACDPQPSVCAQFYRVAQAAPAEHSIFLRGGGSSMPVSASMRQFHTRRQQLLLKQTAAAAAAASSTASNATTVDVPSRISTSSTATTAVLAPRSLLAANSITATRAMERRQTRPQRIHRKKRPNDPASNSNSQPANLGSDPLLSRLFRMPIRQRHSARPARRPANADTTSTTSQPRRRQNSITSVQTSRPTITHTTAQPRRSNASSTVTTSQLHQQPSDPNVNGSATTSATNSTSLLSTAASTNTLTMNSTGAEATIVNEPSRPSLRQRLFRRKAKVNTLQSSTSAALASSPPAATANPTAPIQVSEPRRKPQRRRAPRSGLYLLVCVSLFCMPCLCANYACHRNDDF